MVPTLLKYGLDCFILQNKILNLLFMLCQIKETIKLVHFVAKQVSNCNILNDTVFLQISCRIRDKETRKVFSYVSIFIFSDYINDAWIVNRLPCLTRDM